MKAGAEHGREQLVRSPSSEDISIDDQSDSESTSTSDDVDDVTADSDLRPYIFCTDGKSAPTVLVKSLFVKNIRRQHDTATSHILLDSETRRAFVIKQVTRAQGGHRPAFTFLGIVVEYQGASGSQTERGAASGSSSHRQLRGSQTARGGQTHRTRLVVVAQDLTLDLIYEPPSPKFSSQCPGSSSYRLKLSNATDFLYSVRGLPEQLVIDENKVAVQWGPLVLQYSSPQQMLKFVENVKHVKMLKRQPSLQSMTSSAILRPRPTPALSAVTSENVERSSDVQSCFGSPLPSPLSSPGGSKAAPATADSQSSAQQDVKRPASPAKSTADFNFPGPAETIAAFVLDNWAWIGIGVAAVSLATFVAFKSDSSAADTAHTTAHRYQLHVVE